MRLLSSVFIFICHADQRCIAAKLLKYLRDTQKSDPTLRRYWRLARSNHAFYVMENRLGKTLAKGRLIVPDFGANGSA